MRRTEGTQQGMGRGVEGKCLKPDQSTRSGSGWEMGEWGGALKRSKAERRGSTGTQRRQETVPRETTLSGSFSLVAHSRTGA